MKELKRGKKGKQVEDFSLLSQDIEPGVKILKNLDIEIITISRLWETYRDLFSRLICFLKPEKPSHILDVLNTVPGTIPEMTSDWFHQLVQILKQIEIRNEDILKSEHFLKGFFQIRDRWIILLNRSNQVCHQRINDDLANEITIFSRKLTDISTSATLLEKNFKILAQLTQTVIQKIDKLYIEGAIETELLLESIPNIIHQSQYGLQDLSNQLITFYDQVNEYEET